MFVCYWKELNVKWSEITGEYRLRVPFEFKVEEAICSGSDIHTYVYKNTHLHAYKAVVHLEKCPQRPTHTSWHVCHWTSLLVHKLHLMHLISQASCIINIIHKCMHIFIVWLCVILCKWAICHIFLLLLSFVVSLRRHIIELTGLENR